MGTLSQSTNKQSTLVLPGSCLRSRSLDSNPEAELHLMIQQQEDRKLAETCLPVRQQQPLSQQPRPTLPSADKSVQKQPMRRHQFTSIFGQPVNTSRPTTGMKRPRQQPLNQAIDESEDDEDFVCSKCKKLKQENDQLKRNLEEVQWNPDFSNFQGKRKLVREIGSLRNRRLHQIMLKWPGIVWL